MNDGGGRGGSRGGISSRLARYWPFRAGRA